MVPGYASWLSLGDLDEAIAGFPCVRNAMLRYAKCLIIQLLESVACNSLHNAEERISRWLLDARDRVVGDSFQPVSYTHLDVYKRPDTCRGKTPVSVHRN